MHKEVATIADAEAVEAAADHPMVHLETGDYWVTLQRPAKGITLPIDDRRLTKVRVPEGEYPLAMISLIGSCTEPGSRARRRFRMVPAVGNHHPDGPEFQAGVVVMIGDNTYQVQVPVTDGIAAWVEGWHRARPKAAGKFSVNDPKGAVRRFRMVQRLQALWRGRSERLRLGANAPEMPCVSDLSELIWGDRPMTGNLDELFRLDWVAPMKVTS
jgi:hypothetical protein